MREKERRGEGRGRKRGEVRGGEEGNGRGVQGREGEGRGRERRGVGKMVGRGVDSEQAEIEIGGKRGWKERERWRGGYRRNVRG